MRINHYVGEIFTLSSSQASAPSECLFMIAALKDLTLVGTILYNNIPILKENDKKFKPQFHFLHGLKFQAISKLP